jgi:POT family proton-dependent oligopeptide transporter
MSENTPTSHPRGFYFIFWGEFAERFSYYGMRAILFLYLTQGLMFPDNEAGPIYSAFKMSCYFLPLLGGFLADRYFGKYWTIVGFSIPYVIGQFVLGIPNQIALVFALALLAGGSGVIKPNISTLMGLTYDQKRPGQNSLRTAAFQWFYFSINVGAVLSTFFLPAIRDRLADSYLAGHQFREEIRKSAGGTEATVFHATVDGVEKEISKDEADRLKLEARRYAYPRAFQVPAWLMVAALLAFAAGKKQYAREKIERIEITEEQRRQRWATLKQLFGFFLLVICFWIPYEYNDTLWVAFSRDYIDRHIPFTDSVVAPDQLQFLNPLFVLILIPIFNSLTRRYDSMARFLSAYRKILLGFLLTALAAGVVSMAGFLVQGTAEKLSIWWMAAAYIILTVGEVLLYGTGLELAYTAAPTNIKSFITACFLVTNALANFANIGFTSLYGGSLVDPVEKRGALPPGQFFAMGAVIALLAGFAFSVVCKRLGQNPDAEASPSAA